MIQTYRFFDGDAVEFDDAESVRELIRHAFDQFGYFEPAGMETVTLFQCHHPKTNSGWFTVDTGRKCSDEIINRDELCFAYYMPDVFYFAEGGWGHHMAELGNHPDIPDPVSLKLRFEDFENTVVINGKYCFRDIIGFLKKTQYIPEECNKVIVHMIGTPYSYTLSFDDEIMDLRLTDFENAIEKYNNERFPNCESIYNICESIYNILEIC